MTAPCRWQVLQLKQYFLDTVKSRAMFLVHLAMVFHHTTKTTGETNPFLKNFSTSSCLCIGVIGYGDSPAVETKVRDHILFPRSFLPIALLRE
jgi:hypothetical protein